MLADNLPLGTMDRAKRGHKAMLLDTNNGKKERNHAVLVKSFHDVNPFGFLFLLSS